MAIIKVRQTAVAQWYDIVREAQELSACAVDEELESYLVYMLLRFMDQTDLAEQAVGMAFLAAQQSPFMGRSMLLRNVGDQCLLYSGLYPERATNRGLRVGYYVHIGKRSYSAAADEIRHEINISKMYERLCAQFVTLMDVLHSVRQLGGEEQRLSLKKAMEIWEDTGSLFARKLIVETHS
ncbi:MAG: hypothetical protein M3R00_08590 [Pseudomonadota bacterium]|nr:hypothetical protein [Pseudomonadota bacterium]